MSLTSYRAAPPRVMGVRLLVVSIACRMQERLRFFLEDLAVTYSPAS